MVEDDFTDDDDEIFLNSSKKLRKNSYQTKVLKKEFAKGAKWS